MPAIEYPESAPGTALWKDREQREQSAAEINENAARVAARAASERSGTSNAYSVIGSSVSGGLFISLPHEMEKLTMPTNRIPKAIHSRTMAQSVFVNLVAQLLFSFSQPMLAQSQQKPFASAGQNSQALNEILGVDVMKGGAPTGKWGQVQ
jgi:hypothetical protein